MPNCRDTRGHYRGGFRPAAHILSHSDLRSIARHFAGKDSVRLGEELLPFILHHGMLGADSGRIIPKEVLTELGNGDHHAGRKVLRKFLDNIRRQPARYRHGGAVQHDDADSLDLGPEVFQHARQSGKQLGTNPGGTFTGFPDGIDRYVKAPADEDQARQEVLANRLYQAVAVPVPHAELTRLPSGELAVASQIIPDAKPLKDQRPGAVPELLEHFPADAWLANWDVVGGRKDNILLDNSHSAWRIDQGGALSFKPKGKSKGQHFGKTVEETKTLLDPRYASSEVFHGVELDPDNQTAQRIAALPDHVIRQLVEHYLGDADAYGRNGLADKLIARRDNLAEQYAINPLRRN